MACIAEAMGISLPMAATIPAVHAERLRLAEASGSCAAALARAGPRPDAILSAEAFSNALVVLHAIGGSTNALIHLTAIAARRGIEVDLDAFVRWAPRSGSGRPQIKPALHGTPARPVA